MSRPKYVMVASDVACGKCNGTGEQRLGFMRKANGMAVCDSCHGAAVVEHPMLLEDFAKLFTYGKNFTINTSGESETVDNVICVRGTQAGGDGK